MLTKGYADGGADLAFILRSAGKVVVVPVKEPRKDVDWSFPDTVDGIHHAIKLGANVIWANTTLHSTHPLVTLHKELADVRLVGHNPKTNEQYEDKQWTNQWLAAQLGLQGKFPRAMIYRAGDDGLDDFPLPAVVKPIRGRGSHGVTLVRRKSEMDDAVRTLLKEGDAVLIEVSRHVEEKIDTRSTVPMRRSQSPSCLRGLIP